MSYELVIEAGRTERHYWKDLWRYRELFLILTWRDVAVQYKQTVVGILWAVLRPLLTMAAFTFVFGKVAKLPSEGVAPYPLMVFVAMLPWQFFSTAIAASANSLITNSNLVSKAYFPRIIVPAATIGVAVVDFAISFVLLGGMMVWYQYLPPVQVLAVIPLTLLAAVVALGPGLILCSLNVTYRDFRPPLCRKNGNCCTNAILWSELSTVFAGLCWGPLNFQNARFVSACFAPVCLCCWG